MLARLVAATAAVALVVGLAACQPEPQPSASGPVFASEEEAFAAAEETYRAYVDALNQVDLSDPETFEAVYAWTTGELNATDRKNFSSWHADGYEKSGDAVITAMTGAEVRGLETSEPTVILDACYDVSGVDVRDGEGVSIVSPDRPAVQSLSVTFAPADTSTRLIVESITGSESSQSC
jgi:hypothetical protein